MNNDDYAENNTPHRVLEDPMVTADRELAEIEESMTKTEEDIVRLEKEIAKTGKVRSHDKPAPADEGTLSDPGEKDDAAEPFGETVPEEGGAADPKERKKAEKEEKNAAKAEKKKMKALKKMSRRELLDMLLKLRTQLDATQKELEETKAALADKTINIEKSGSIAEASLAVTKIFEEAQRAAELYLVNVKRQAE